MDLDLLQNAGDFMMGKGLSTNQEEMTMQVAHANAIFSQLREASHVEVQQIMQAIGETRHPYVLHQLADLLSLSLLRHWHQTEGIEIDQVLMTVIRYVSQSEGLEPFMVQNFIKTAAIILKRDMKEQRVKTHAQVIEMIRELILNPSNLCQSVGLQLIRSLTEQIVSAWGHSKLGITFDFHLNAKKEFEAHMLKKIFEMVIDWMRKSTQDPSLTTNADSMRALNYLLEVSEITLNWSFGDSMISQYAADRQAVFVNFRPPAEWVSFIDRGEHDFTDIFFQVLNAVRNHSEELTTRCLNCLTAMATFMGSIMNDRELQVDYITRFVNNIIATFMTGPKYHELNGFCTLLQKLLNRPAQGLLRLPQETRTRLFLFCAEFMKERIGPAMTNAIASDEHYEHVSIALLIDAWMHLIYSKWNIGLNSKEAYEIEEELLLEPTRGVVNMSVQALMAPPIGTRPMPPDVEQDDDDEEQDDRMQFRDILLPVGSLGTYVCTEFLPNMTGLLHQKLNELKVNLRNQQFEEQSYKIWLEDMHWILLILAHTILHEKGGTYTIQENVINMGKELMEEREGPFDEDFKNQYIIQCITDPMADFPDCSPDIDPFIMLLGKILSWSAIQHEMIVSEHFSGLVSPEVVRGTVFVMRQYLEAATTIPDGSENTYLPLLYTNDVLSDTLVQLVLKVLFGIFERFSGEVKLCSEAVDLLTVLVNSRAEHLARGTQLNDALARLDLSKLPVKTSLVKAFVLIAAQSQDEQLQVSMYDQFLRPLLHRFAERCSGPSTSDADSDLTDLLHCFVGLAQAGSSETAIALVDFIEPLLDACGPLMSSRAHCQPVIAAILQFVHETVDKIFPYVDEQGDKLYATLLAIIQRFCVNQATVLADMDPTVDEEKAETLSTFMTILHDLLSRTLVNFNNDNEERVKIGSRAALEALEMLISIMKAKALHSPELAASYYKLISKVVDFSSDTVEAMSENLLAEIMMTLERALLCEFGDEICSKAADTYADLVIYLARHRDIHPAFVSQRVAQLTPTIFSGCVSTVNDTHGFGRLSGALFANIIFDRSSFEAHFANLVNYERNLPVRDNLIFKFQKFMQLEGLKLEARSRVQFRKLLDTFFTKIQGMLYIP